METNKHPPLRIMSTGIACAVLLAIACVLLATRTPYLDVQWQADGTREAAPLARIPGSHARLRIYAIRGGVGSAMGLQNDDLAVEPDQVFENLDEVDRFIDRQSRLHAILLTGSVLLDTEIGPLGPFEVRAHRPLATLPWAFWVQVLCACAGLVAGATLLAFRQRDPAVWWYALCGVGIALFAGAAAIYSTRALALPGPLMYATSSANVFGAQFSFGAVLAMLWYFPVRVARLRAGPWIIGCYAAVGLGIPLRVFDSYTPTLIAVATGFCGMALLFLMQWRLTRTDASARTALLWFGNSWLFAMAVFATLMGSPILLKSNVGELQVYAFVTDILIYTVMAVGLARLRMYRFSDWWGTAWTVYFGGVSVLALDALFTLVLGLAGEIPLLLGLALAGWVYFPLRQWGWTRLAQRGSRSDLKLPQLLRRILATRNSEPQAMLPEALRVLFRPLESRVAACEDRVASISDDGQMLRIPGDNRSPALELWFPDQGRRLFNVRDLEQAQTVQAVIRQLVAYRNAIDEGMEQERTRLARDLHDDIGARMMTLAHKTKGEVSLAITEALDELRLVVHSLGAGPRPLNDVLADLRAETAERCEANNIDLRWSTTIAAPAMLDATACLDLARMIREAVSNALRHAAPRYVAVEFLPAASGMRCAIEHDGTNVPAPEWKPGLGLRNLRARAESLGHTPLRLLAPRSGVARIEWMVVVAAMPTLAVSA